MGGKGSGRKKSKIRLLTPAAKQMLKELGRIGGETRAANLTLEQRRAISIKAAKASAIARSLKAKGRTDAT